MDVNEDAPIDAGATWDEADHPRPSRLGSAWRGAKTGVRLTSYIVGPMAALFVIPGLALMELGLGAGHGLGFPEFALGGLGFYLVCAAWAGLIGAAIGLVRTLGERAPRLSVRHFLWVAGNRPIRLFRSRPTAAVRGAPPRSMSRPGRWPFLVGVPVQLVLWAAFGAGVYLSREVQRRLGEATAEADLDDPYWRLDELLANRIPVPDSENSALVVAEALGLVPPGWPAAPPPAPGQSRPPTTPASQALDSLNATPQNVRLDDATADALRLELETYREAVQIGRTLAFYDRGRHELEIAPTVFDTLLPETQAARTAARLLAADVAIRAHDDDIDGALDSCRAILGAGRSIGDEPFAISQLVRLAIGQVATASIRRVLGQGEPSDAALERVQSLVLDELAQPLLLFAVRGERASLYELMRRIRTGELPISALADSHAKPARVSFRTTVAPWDRLRYDHQMAVGLEWLNQAVAIAQRPVVERPPIWDDWEADMDRARRTWHFAYTAVLPAMMMPTLRTSSLSHARCETDLGAMAILLAAERHRVKTGSWPTSIAAIDPAILADAPLDPFSGEDYRMEHRDGRLLIYSIGPNHTDEHGAYDPKKWTTGGPDDVGAIGWDVDRRGQPAAGEGAETSTRQRPYDPGKEDPHVGQALSLTGRGPSG